MSLRRLRHVAEYVVFRFLCAIIGMLNLRQTIGVANALAWVFVNLLPRKLTRYAVARDNIERAFPGQYAGSEMDDFIRRMWVHLFRLVAEVVQFPRKMCLTNCRDVIVFRNRRAALQALTTGRPVFILGGHFGNWEASTATFGLIGFPMGIVARAMDNPYLHRWFAQSREQVGHKLILKRGGWEEMIALLNRGGNVGLLCDQDAGKRGVFVDFFGHPASTFKSIALMAIEYNALLVVGYGLRLPDDLREARWARFEVGCEEIIDPATLISDDPLREITTRFTAALERAIRRAPDQYFWVHRRWKTPPRETRKKLKEAA